MIARETRRAHQGGWVDAPADEARRVAAEGRRGVRWGGGCRAAGKDDAPDDVS